MTASAITSTTSTPKAQTTSDSSADSKGQKEAKGISTASSIRPAAPEKRSWSEPYLMLQESVYKFNDGSHFCGALDADGLPSGRGVVRFALGGHYEGAFLKGVKEGYGIQVEADGRKYVGQFSGDQFHGEGVLTIPNKEKFEGTFEKGEFKIGKHYPDISKNPEKYEEYVKVPASKCIIS